MQADGCFQWDPSAAEPKKNKTDLEVLGTLNCRGGSSHDLSILVTEDGKVGRLATR